MRTSGILARGWGEVPGATPPLENRCSQTLTGVAENA